MVSEKYNILLLPFNFSKLCRKNFNLLLITVKNFKLVCGNLYNAIDMEKCESNVPSSNVDEKSSALDVWLAGFKRWFRC